MERPASRFVPYEMQTTILRITSYQGKILKGSLSNPFFEEDQLFTGCIPLLQLMEDMLDSLRFPQRAMECRTFDASAKRMPRDANRQPARTLEPALATFRLRVLFRQNASWQGEIVWLEKQAAAGFRSVLELIGILDSALEDSL